MTETIDLGHGELRIMQTNVLVVGGALSGLSAAIAASSIGKDVTLLSKGEPGRSGCSLYIGGFITWCPPTQRESLRDQILWTGGFLGNPSLVDVVVNRLDAALEQLGSFGLPLRVSGSSKLPGSMEIGEVPGQPRGYLLGQVLAEQARKQGVTMLTSLTLVALLTHPEEGVCGALAVDPQNNHLVAIEAPEVILATGGGARAFARADNPKDITGDGFLLALEAGADLVDLELINFWLSHEEMEEGLRLGPRAIANKGNAHYFLGGIAIDASASTKVPGLYAAGEVTGGVFGAARLGASALADCLVFGLIAGETAAKSPRTAQRKKFEDTLERRLYDLFRTFGDEASDLRQMRQQIGDIAWSYAGYVKDEFHLQRGRKQLEALQPAVSALQVTEIADLVALHEVRSIYHTALVSTKAALLRQETRGNFWRSDYPKPDPVGGLFNTISSMDDGVINVVKRPLTHSLPNPTPPIRIAPGCLSYDFTAYGEEE